MPKPRPFAGIRRCRRRIWIPAALLVLCAAAEPASLDDAPEQSVSSTRPAAGISDADADPVPAPFERGYILPIRGTITDITYESFMRRLEQIEAKEPEVLIVELDTPGGAVTATLDICNEIKRLRDRGVTVYAWVNDEAYSGGTIIALATDGILMAGNATIGDCQPIVLTGAGASALEKDIEAKFTSPLVAELEDSARRNNHDFDMILSFIRPEMIMYWVVNTETGEKRFVTDTQRDRLFGRTGTDTRSQSADDDADGEDGKKARPQVSEAVGDDDDSTTAWRYVKEVPGFGEVRQPVVDGRTLLTMRTDKAIAFGFCLEQINSEDDLGQFLGIPGTLPRLESNVVESLIEWLASPMVRTVLFLIMMLGAYTEFKAPGFGLPGAVALVAMTLFLGAPYLAGYTVTWEIVAIILGMGLLAVEMFVIPGFGVAGMLGIILLTVGLLASFVPAEPSLPGEDWFRLPSLKITYMYLEKGMISLATGLVSSIAGMALIAKYFPRLPVGNRIVIPNPTPEQIHADDPYDGAASVGDLGRTESLLRPAGKARFGATLVDVISEGEYIPGGTRVEVVQRRGNRVVVRRAE